MTGLGSADGSNIPLEDDERDGLLPNHIVTRAELNQWVAVNLAQAHEWLARKRDTNILNVDFLHQLHRRMFDQTWKWAGTFRRSDKNISPHHWSTVPQLMKDLMENTAEQHSRSPRSADSIDDIALRFHHQMVRIHPWPNGNGRHARLATDLLLKQWQHAAFTWGGRGDLEAVSEARATYVAALRAADAGDFTLLRAFVRS